MQEPIPVMDNTGIWNPVSAGRDLTWILPHPAHTCQKLKRRTCLLSLASRTAATSASSVSSPPRTRRNDEDILNCDHELNIIS